MICADYECRRCHAVHEFMVDNGRKPKCPVCGANTKRIFTAGRVNMTNETPSWIASVIDVVDKDSTKSHVKEFIKHPTRTNYKNWMRGEGIRPLDHTEHGGPPVYHPRPEVDTSKLRDEVARRHFERKRIEVG